MFALHVTRSIQASRKSLILVVESIASTSALVLLKSKQLARKYLKMRHGCIPGAFFYVCRFTRYLKQFKDHIDMVIKLNFVMEIPAWSRLFHVSAAAHGFHAKAWLWVTHG